eukprot:scaffold306_cov149-Amphora_coffeaeformis.AAC.2
MNYESNKNDTNTLPERITLLDCMRLHAVSVHQHQQRAQPQRGTDSNQDTPRGVSKDKLRKIFDDIMDILEDSTFDSDQDE